MPSFRLYTSLALALLGCAESHAALVPGEENLFVAAASEGMLALSADGVAWERVSTGVTDDINDVVFGEGRVVALSAAGEVFTSANGRAWRRTVLEPGGGEWSDPE